MVVCRTAGGDIAFLANHMAYVGALEPCPLRVVHPQETLLGTQGSQLGDELRFAVHGGFVEVSDNRVVALCDVAEPAGEIDTQRAERPRPAPSPACLLTQATTRRKRRYEGRK